MAVLEAKNLGIAFGGLRALQDVQFSIGEKEIIGLIGPNGAGKTNTRSSVRMCMFPRRGPSPLKTKISWEKRRTRSHRGESPAHSKYPFV